MSKTILAQFKKCWEKLSSAEWFRRNYFYKFLDFAFWWCYTCFKFNKPLKTVEVEITFRDALTESPGGWEPDRDAARQMDHRGCGEIAEARVPRNVAPALRVRNVLAFCERTDFIRKARWYHRSFRLSLMRTGIFYLLRQKRLLRFTFCQHRPDKR